MFNLPDFSVAYPELFLLFMISLTLLVDVFVADKKSSLRYYFTQASIIGTFFVVLSQYGGYSGATISFDGQYVLDSLALISKLFVCVGTLFAFSYAREYILERQISEGDYYLLGLFCLLGMLIMASAYTFLTIYLGLELVSLTLYAMVALQKRSLVATEAAMKFFVMGALASGLLLYGISIIYGVTGSIQMTEIGNTLANMTTLQTPAVVLGLVFILAGLIFKFGAVPFHMWVPDVYEGAPTSMTLFIASAPKVVAFTITMRILVEALPSVHVSWQHVLIVVALLSMFFGNVLAIAQVNIKRMLAYSSIAHIGYTLLGIIAGPHSAQGYSAGMFYITTYALVAGGGFAMVALLSHQGREFETLNDYRGLNARHPWLAFMMLLLMFSMAGIPPTVGFFAKLGLLEALVEAHLVWLAALALLFAIIGAYYYLRVVMLMYFEEPEEAVRGIRITLSKERLLAISANGVAVLVLGMLPSGLIDLCRVSLG